MPEQQPGGRNAWARINSLLNTREAVADALLQHLQHVHATLPRGCNSSVQFRLLPGRLHILLREGSGRVTIITQGGPKRFEARLSSDAAKVRQLLCEYAWSARAYTLEVVVVNNSSQAKVVAVPDSRVPNIKRAVAQALCPGLAMESEQLGNVIDSGSNEVFLYTLATQGNGSDADADADINAKNVLGYFCVGHEHVQAPEECDADDDTSDDDDDDDDGDDGTEDEEVQDFDELASMLELTPLPPRQQQPASANSKSQQQQPQSQWRRPSSSSNLKNSTTTTTTNSNIQAPVPAAAKTKPPQPKPATATTTSTTGAKPKAPSKYKPQKKPSSAPCTTTTTTNNSKAKPHPKPAATAAVGAAVKPRAPPINNNKLVVLL